MTMLLSDWILKKNQKLKSASFKIHPSPLLVPMIVFVNLYIQATLSTNKYLFLLNSNVCIICIMTKYQNECIL